MCESVCVSLALILAGKQQGRLTHHTDFEFLSSMASQKQQNKRASSASSVVSDSASVLAGSVASFSCGKQDKKKQQKKQGALG